MHDFILTSEGDLSLAFIAMLWVFSLIASIPYFRTLKATEPGSPERIKTSRNLMLIAVWPLIAMLAFVLIPFVMIWLIMQALVAASPVFIAVFVEPVDQAIRGISRMFRGHKARANHPFS
jgi:Na+/H+ antiporter NhaD/arsenite permease-like protein